MPRGELLSYVAFLRAINVGGHVVKMDRLKRVFEALGLEGVATFIASGNVYFESPSRDAAALERRIASRLHATLGYEVATFIRSTAEVQAIAAFHPFTARDTDQAAGTLFVGFLHAAPARTALGHLRALNTATDRLRVRGRELYWDRQGAMLDSPISGAVLEKTLGVPVTLRNITTVRKLAAKYTAT